MSSSTSNPPRFLLDENVRIELDESLALQKIDIKRLPKGTPDATLAAASKRENRALVTNDEDFSLLSQDKVFSVVWLKIPQKELATLITSFKKMLNECTVFAKKLIIVEPNNWKAFPLGRIEYRGGGVIITKYG